MKNEEIIRAIQKVIVEDLSDFAQASDTLCSEQFARAVIDTAYVYKPFISDGLSRRAIGSTFETPPGKLVGLCSKMCKEIFDSIIDTDNVKTLMGYIADASTLQTASKRKAEILAKMAHAITEVI